MTSPKLPIVALLASACLVSVVQLSAQSTHTWTGDAANNVLFDAAGYSNWDPALPGTMNLTVNGTDADIYVFDGSVPAMTGAGPLSIDVAYANIGRLVFDNTGGLLGSNVGIGAYPDNVPTATRVLKFNTPDTTVIELTANVTGTVSIGTDRDAYGPMGIRLPESGVSTIHVANASAVLDLSELVDNFTGRGGVHSGSTTQADARGALRKTGDGTLNLSIRDGQGTRVQNLIIEGGTVIIGKVEDMTWITTTFLADAVTIDGGRLEFNSTSSSTSNAQRGLTLGAAGAEIAVTNTGAMALTGAIAGAGQLTKTGTGTLTLTNTVDFPASSFNGGLVIEAGTIRVGRFGALGAGTVQLGVPGGGDASLSSYLAGWNYANAIVVPAGVDGVVSLGTESTAAFNTIFSGPITVDGPLSVTSASPSGNRLSFTGVLSGSGDITKVGPGQWRLFEANTWDGNLTISEGDIYFDTDSEQRFTLQDGGVTNFIGGTGGVTFAGLFRIDPSALTDTLGSWHLVDMDALTATILGSFNLSILGSESVFTELGGGLYQDGDWHFDSGTGTLTLIPEPGVVAAWFGLVVLGMTALRRRRMPRT